MVVIYVLLEQLGQVDHVLLVRLEHIQGKVHQNVLVVRLVNIQMQVHQHV